MIKENLHFCYRYSEKIITIVKEKDCFEKHVFTMVVSTRYGARSRYIVTVIILNQIYKTSQATSFKDFWRKIYTKAAKRPLCNRREFRVPNRQVCC